MIELCAQHYIPDPYMQFDFIDCIETLDTDKAYTRNIDTCVNTLGIDQATKDQIESCWDGPNSEQGIQWMHQVALTTAALNPPHEYVPWLVSNGAHNSIEQNAITESLWDYVCLKYTGTNRSPDCPLQSEPKEVSKQVLSVSPKSDNFLQ